MQICSNFILLIHSAMQAKHLIIAVLVSFCTAAGFSQEVSQNRKPYAAGRFYTNNPVELKAQLQELFAKSVKKKPGYMGIPPIAS